VTITDASGNVAGTVTFTVPVGTAGSHTIELTAGTRSAGTTLTVAPAISLSPATGSAGTTATITGAGFAASSPIIATFGGAGVAVAGGPSSATGSFTATYTVPNQAPGDATVVATDASTNSAAAAYTINIPSTGLNPAGAIDGATVTLSGANFPAGSTITGTWDGGALTLSGSTTTTAAGEIPSGVTFTVPSTATGGPHTVQVTAAGQSANATFTVMPTFVVTASTPQAAGTPFAVTITAMAGGQTDTAYAGTKSLIFSGPG
jgi:hypothetical protein